MAKTSSSCIDQSPKALWELELKSLTSVLFSRNSMAVCSQGSADTVLTQNLLCCICSILLHQGMTDKHTASSTVLGGKMQVVVLGSEERTMKNTMIWTAIQGIQVRNYKHLSKYISKIQTCCMRIVSLRHNPLFLTPCTNYMKAAQFLFYTKQKELHLLMQVKSTTTFVFNSTLIHYQVLKISQGWHNSLLYLFNVCFQLNIAHSEVISNKNCSILAEMYVVGSDCPLVSLPAIS